MKRHIKLFEDFSSTTGGFRWEEYDEKRFTSVPEDEDWNMWWNDTCYHLGLLLKASKGTVETQFGSWHINPQILSNDAWNEETFDFASDDWRHLKEGDIEIDITPWPYVSISAGQGGIKDAIIVNAFRPGSMQRISGPGERCTVYDLTSVLTGGKAPSPGLEVESAERLLSLISGTIDAVMSQPEMDSESFRKRRRSRSAFGRF